MALGGLVTCGRVWWHVVGCGSMWKGVVASSGGTGHVAGVGACDKG